jgi:hypothetical protein
MERGGDSLRLGTNQMLQQNEDLGQFLNPMQQDEIDLFESGILGV